MNNRRKINHRGHRGKTQRTQRKIKIFIPLLLCALCVPFSAPSVVNSSFDPAREI
jgi:hypothetical protein